MSESTDPPPGRAGRARRWWGVTRSVVRPMAVAALAALVAGGVALAAWVVWVLGPGAAWWLEHVDGVTVGGKDGLRGKDLADALDVVRGRAMALGTGLLAAVAIYYTASNATSARRTANAAHRSAEIAEEGLRRTLELTEQGQVTGRYTAAIEQLGSDKLDIRLGGIYALERIARDSSRDHPTVMAVLAAFVREHSHDPDVREEERTDGNQDRQTRYRLRPDLQAALNVLARGDTDHDTNSIDLTGADLRGTNLVGTNLVGADLSDADLRGAYLTLANLTRANLRGANLIHAMLRNANLSDAHLHGADLRRAHLGGANLTDADLTDAHLAGVIWSEDTVWPKDVGGANGMRARSDDLGGGLFRRIRSE